MMIWAIVIAGSITLLTSCNNSGKISNSQHADTVVLYKKDSLLKVGTTPLVVQCPLNQTLQLPVDSAKKTLLLIEEVKLQENPEGAYEIYITGTPPITKNLSSTRPEFITTLDLYSITATGSRQRIEIDISDKIKNTFAGQSQVNLLYLVILFSPIKMADGSYSDKAGRLEAGGLQLIQTNN